MPQTVQQQRAAWALREVQNAVASNTVRKNKEFRSYASELPAMIHMSGLGQAAAFYRSKSAGGAHRQLYDLLSGWLTGEGQPYAQYQNLLEGITQSDRHRYRLAQAEAEAFMDWVKKFANAFIERDG